MPPIKLLIPEWLLNQRVSPVHIVGEEVSIPLLFQAVVVQLLITVLRIQDLVEYLHQW